jgi:type II secretory pathway predicted ATPase ExeA
MLQTILTANHISQGALGKAVALSKSAVSRIVAHGEWPRRDAGAPKRVADYLLSQGVSQDALEIIFPVQEKAPDVVTHAEAVPEATTTATQEETMLLRYETLTQQALQHFGLVRSPFVDDVRTRADVFSNKNMRYVRAVLLDAAQNQGFIGLVGESGAGKSTLVDELEERITDEGHQIIIVRPSVLAMEENDEKGRTLKSGQIAEAIIRTLDPSASPKRSPEARDRQVHALLKSSRTAGYSVLLVIEEAHCLPIATLKHLKRFREIKQGLARLMGVCLVGQTELRARLSEQKAEVREVVQRCELVELEPLDNDLEAYLIHKFKRMDMTSDDVLAADAFDAIRARLIRMPRGGKPSDAISLCYPQVVNNLLTRAMNAAAMNGWPKVDAQVIGGC